MFRILVSTLFLVISTPVVLAVDGGVISIWGYGGEGLSAVPQPNDDFIAVAAGLSHDLAIRDADSNGVGEIMAWGRNTEGQCNVPAPNINFIAVAAGSYHSLGLRADGSVVAWGHNSQGQCNIPAPNSSFIAIAAGDTHSLGLKSDGTIVGWGSNGNGQTAVPPPNGGFTGVAAGSFHSLGLKAGGVAVAWGNNSAGQCNIPSPNSGFVSIAGGDAHSLGVKGDGSVVAWGNNSYGQLNLPQPNGGFMAVAAGTYHNLGLKAGGAIVAWGRNDQGQCNVPAETNYMAVAAAGAHSASISASTMSSGAIMVDDSTTNGAPDGLTWETALPDIQQALAVAIGNNLVYEIWVAEGTYVPSSASNRTATFQLQSGLAILGGFSGNETEADERDPAAHVTVLSGDINRDDFFGFVVDNSYHVVTGSGVDATAILDGFTVTAGNANSGAPNDRGSLVYTSTGSPTLKNCVLTNSLAGRAMYNENSSSTIQQCEFLSNDFGAMQNLASGLPRTMTIDGCVFAGNQVNGVGAAIYSVGGPLTVIVRDSVFDDNWTSSFSGGGAIRSQGSGASLIVERCTFANNFGGGVSCYDTSSSSSIQIRDCLFSDNLAFDYGGAFANYSCDSCSLATVTLQRCQFINNFASSYGGAIYLDGSATTTTARIENCVFRDNRSDSGGAAYVRCYAEVLNSTISKNEAQDAGGIYKVGSGLVVNNSILWHNQANSGNVQSAQLTYTGTTPTVNFTNLENLDIISFGPGNIDEEPQFVSATDLHIAAGSPCIDAGANQIVPPGPDGDGNPRFFDDPTIIDTGLGTSPIVDMGAYEYQPLVNPNDADNDGIANNTDNCPQVYNPSQADFDADGAGDVCDGDIDNDSVLNGADACDFTPVGSFVQPDGTLRADLDGDCDVDSVDFSIMQSEFTGPN